MKLHFYKHVVCHAFIQKNVSAQACFSTLHNTKLVPHESLSQICHSLCNTTTASEALDKTVTTDTFYPRTVFMT